MDTPHAGGRKLMIEVHTWERESHDLFDYEAKNPHEGRLFVPNCAGKLIRIEHEVRYFTEQEECPDGSDHILSIRCDKDHRYSIVPADPTRLSARSYQRRLWMIVQKLPTGRHVMNENDIIKLGRCKMKVKQLIRTREAAAEFKLDDSKPLVCNSNPQDMVEIQCRICLAEGEGEHGPLVRPCNCKGSIEYVHVECLRWWISGRLNISGHPRGSFLFRRIKCEVCKEPFPTVIEHNQDKIQVVHIPEYNKEPPFVVLESVITGSSTSTYVTSMAEGRDRKLGRGHDSDVRISDVSISRHHATISFVGGEFLLEDNHSKFGTLVAKRHPICMDVDGRAWVQAGRSILHVSFVNDESVENLEKYVSSSQSEFHPPPPPPSENGGDTNTEDYNPFSNINTQGGPISNIDSSLRKYSSSTLPPCNSVSNWYFLATSSAGPFFASSYASAAGSNPHFLPSSLRVPNTFLQNSERSDNYCVCSIENEEENITNFASSSFVENSTEENQSDLIHQSSRNYTQNSSNVFMDKRDSSVSSLRDARECYIRSATTTPNITQLPMM